MKNFLVTSIWFWWDLATCPKNDGILFSRKRFVH